MRHLPLKKDDEAVSAVISTILMVAITVVLAATAFVLIADVGKESTVAPLAIGMRSDETQDRLEVVSSAGGANWNRIAVRVTSNIGGGTIYMGSSAASGYFNEAASTSGADISTQTPVSDSSASMSGGDYIEFCRSGGASGEAVIMVLDIEAGAVISEYRLLSLEPGSC